MRSLIIILFLLSTLGLIAQPPQGINYQAVAFGAGSQPLSNRTIGVRLSVLDNSSSGTVVYTEVHTVSTDTTGPFSLVIGAGTATNGTFAGIDWAHNSKWLKTEIDTAGGVSYATVGVTQFMSVPYALYAGQSKPNTVTMEYPDGLDSLIPVTLGYGLNYTVPAGKNFYIGSINGANSSINTIPGRFLLINGDTMSFESIQQYELPITFGPGTHIQKDSVTLTGFLVNKRVEWLYWDLGTVYTVPAGKVLYVKRVFLDYRNGSGNANDVFLINGVNVGNLGWMSPSLPILVDESQSISLSSPRGNKASLIGYLKSK